MKHILGVIFIVILTSGCGGLESQQPNPTGSGKPPKPTVPTGPTIVDNLISIENNWRVTQGQAPLTKGLSCTLYTVPSGTSAIAGASLTTIGSFLYLGEINQPNSPANQGLNILPGVLKPLYTAWFIVRCTGKIVIEESGYYSFELSSDDGSVLYIAGSKIIDNDGNHGIVTKNGVKLLRMGVHDFRLDFMQGPSGSQALILKSSGSVVPASVLYH